MHKVWVRDGVVPRYPNIAPPQFDMAQGGLIIPAPRNKRQDIQEQSIRDAEINPDLYYPKEYHPELIENWPSDKAVFLPESKVPDSMKKKK